MPETTDLPVDLPKEYRFEFGPVRSAVIGSLAIYGAVELSRNASRKVKLVRENWKIKQAEKKAVKANNTPTP